MALTVEDYENVYWPQLREAIDMLLLQTSEVTTGQRISFEQMYSAVYKCVCKQYSERLYQDLLNHVKQILQRYV